MEEWVSGMEEWVSGREEWVCGREEWVSGREEWVSGREEWVSGSEEWRFEEPSGVIKGIITCTVQLAKHEATKHTVILSSCVKD
ncbi:hypothetical protein Pcinc_038528 [Petrolisthes cinctipes]|uniref:Uncharacterized protein n=1 Tax=Petrolisthes cinctipes TaxID=88211 RepID=A0AAE1EK85_PETCI|nr:hypothetical protein Pcinc_038528 [Petrolisthes cinctipes]